MEHMKNAIISHCNFQGLEASREKTQKQTAALLKRMFVINVQWRLQNVKNHYEYIF